MAKFRKFRMVIKKMMVITTIMLPVRAMLENSNMELMKGMYSAIKTNETKNVEYFLNEWMIKNHRCLEGCPTQYIMPSAIITTLTADLHKFIEDINQTKDNCVYKFIIERVNNIKSEELKELVFAAHATKVALKYEHLSY